MTPLAVRNWSKLFGTSSEDVALDITTGNDGSIYISGFTKGNLNGETNSGDKDVFISKFKMQNGSE